MVSPRHAANGCAFLDDDDLWAPDKLARQLAAARESGRDWAYTGGVVFLGDRIIRAQVPLPPDAMVKTLLRYDAIPGGGSNVIMRRALWPHTGPFNTQLRSGEDWEMWIRLAKHGIPAWVCAPLVAKRLHSTNATLDTQKSSTGPATSSGCTASTPTGEFFTTGWDTCVSVWATAVRRSVTLPGPLHTGRYAGGSAMQSVSSARRWDLDSEERTMRVRIRVIAGSPRLSSGCGSSWPRSAGGAALATVRER